MKTYLCVYFGTLLLALGFTPLVARVAKAVHLADAPGVRKVHKAAIPRIGGVAIVVSMLAMIIPVLALDNVIGEAFRKIQTRAIVLLATSFFIFAVGLVDDIRGLRASVKLLAQIAAALFACAFGIRIGAVSVGNWLALDFGHLAWPITIVWIVGITNAVNLIDGLDGLAAGISAVTCGVIAALAVCTHQPVMAVLMLALLGSLTSFLVFNFNPARVFMGDCGSQFLGFLLATASVMCASKSAALVGLALPAVALGVPIFDTLFSIVRRILERRSIFAPDRSHIHHRLIDMGLRQRHVVLIMYAVTVGVVGLGMFMMVTRDESTVVILVCILLLLLLLFRVVGSVRLRESLAILQRNLLISRQVRQQKRNFEDAQLRMHSAKSFGAWWRAACAAAEEMDFARLSLVLPATCCALAGDGSTTRTLRWRRPGCKFAPNELLSMAVPIRRCGGGSLFLARIDVPINGSLELAGHQAALFSRLIDEQDLPDFSGCETPPHPGVPDWPTQGQRLRRTAAASGGKKQTFLQTLSPQEQKDRVPVARCIP